MSFGAISLSGLVIGEGSRERGVADGDESSSMRGN